MMEPPRFLGAAFFVKFFKMMEVKFTKFSKLRKLITR